MEDAKPLEEPSEHPEAKAAAASAALEVAAVRAVVVADEEIKQSAGQRAINRIWEYTQSFIAISVTIVTLAVSAMIVIRRHPETEPTAISLLSNSLFLVIGFYFGRTNHTRQGGIGIKNEPR